MRSRTWLFFLFLFIFSSCNPRAKQSTSFNSATSLSDETVKFLPPAVDAEYIDGGVRLETMIPGDASHVEINFNGTFLKSCSAETLIPEGVATCPVGEESCEIQVKACNEATKECSESLDVTVFMDTESAFPSDVDSVMKAYKLEQEQLQLARDLKLDACVAAKEVEKYSEADVSAEVLALRDGIEAICKTSDCDILLGFDQFKSDLEDLIAQLALQDILEDDDTNDFDEEDTNKLSDTEIVLTAVSATLGAALLGGGGTGIYLWRKQARAPGELVARDLEIKELNEKIVNISKQNAELEKNKAQANDADKAKISSLQELLKKEKEAVISLKRQRIYLVTARNDLQKQLENTKIDKLDLEKLRVDLAVATNNNSQLTEQIGKLQKIEEELLAKNLQIENLNTELKENKAKNDVDNTEIARLNELLKKEKGAVTSLEKDKNDLLIANKNLKEKLRTLQADLEAANSKNSELTQKIEDLEKIAKEKTELDQKIEALKLKKIEANQLATNLKSKNIFLSFRIGSLKNSDTKNKAKIAELEAQVASNNTKIAELETSIQAKDALLAQSQNQNQELTQKLEAQSKELEELREIKQDFDKIAPQLTTALEDKERLEEELMALKDVQALLETETQKNEANRQSIAELQEQLKNAKTPEEEAAEAKKLADLQTDVDKKAKDIDELNTQLKEADKKGTLSRIFMMMQRKIHQAEMDERLKNRTDQVDAMANDFDEQYANKNDEIAGLEKEFDELKNENEPLTNAFAEKDKLLKAAQEKTRNLEKNLASLQENVPGNNENIKKLKAEIQKLKNGAEYYKENVKLKNHMQNYANKALSTLSYLLNTKEVTQKTNRELMIRLASVVNYADKNGLIDGKDVKIQQFIRDVSIKKIALTSDSTDDFVERVSQFFSTVAAKHAKAYENNLELEELRANFF